MLVFEKDLDPERIIRSLSLLVKTSIVPGSTFLFLDEVQEAPQAIIALRYFYEKMPNLHCPNRGQKWSRKDFAKFAPFFRHTFKILTGHSLFCIGLLSNEGRNDKFRRPSYAR